MRKTLTSFSLLLVVTLSSDSLDDQDFKIQTSAINVLVKFQERIITRSSSVHSMHEFGSETIRQQLRQFGIQETKAVFNNRYYADGSLKCGLAAANPYYLEGWQRISLQSSVMADNFISRLKNVDGVEYILLETPVRIKAAVAPNDPDYTGNGQWYLNDPYHPNADIDAELAWDINKGRNDVVVAILDGGVDYTHPDLDPGNRSRVIQGFDTGEMDSDPMDDLIGPADSFAGHGTNVAGVVGAITDNGQQIAGLMWNCKIMPVKMVRNGGIKIPFVGDWDWSTTAFPGDVADAIDYAVNNGAHVINLSYGFHDKGWLINEVAFRVPLLYQAIDNAYKNNVVITASMGNEYDDGDNSVVYPAGFYEQVIAVGATGNNGLRTAFSNTGPHISVSAPGEFIRTSARGGGTDIVSGTSFSAPLTAATAGLVISQGKDRNFNLTNDDVRKIIELTAHDVPDYGYGFDQETGYGIINAHDALQLIEQPNVLYHYNAIGGTAVKTATLSQWILLDNRWGIAAGTYFGVDQYKITRHVTFNVPFCSIPLVWMRKRESKCLSPGNPNSGKQFVNISNVSPTGFDIEYYVYYVRYDGAAKQINKWIPSSKTTSNVACTVVGQPDPVALAGPIIGADVVCSSETYSINNLPSGATVTWSSTWNSAPYPQLVPNTPNPNELTINNVYMYPSSTTLTATVSGSCGAPVVLTKPIGSDYYSTYQTGTYFQEACWANNTYQSQLSGTLPAGGAPLYLHQGCMAQITLYNMGGKSVTFTGSMQPTYWNYDSNTSKLWLQLPLYSGGIPFTFKVSGNGACQEKTLLFFSYLSSSSMMYEISPNPVEETLSLNIHLGDDIILEKGIERAISEMKVTTSIFDMSSGEMVDQSRDFSGALRHEIDVSRLKAGVYSLRIRREEEVKLLRFIKQ